jgi:hypothetical protein
MQWTTAYYGVQHCGTCSLKTRWATVEDYGTVAVLSCWFPGCGFYPEQIDFKSAELARQRGVRFIVGA